MFLVIVDFAANIPSCIVQKYDIEVLSMNVYVNGSEIKGYEPNLTVT